MNQEIISKKRVILITNDDGIYSPFLIPLLKSIRKSGDLYVVAPSAEQSWSGSKVHQSLKPESVMLPFCKRAWSIVNGSPVTCVDIAYHQLLPQKPDIIISGVNIGANTSWQYILSSGTFAAAQHGFNLNVPSIAISQALSADLKKIDRSGSTPILKQQEDILDNNFHPIPQWIESISNQAFPELWNINFPYLIDNSTDIVYAKPALFKKTEFYARSSNNTFLFDPKSEETLETYSDRDGLREGKISISRFFKNLS